MPDCLIGVDPGTSGCRALAIDAALSPIAAFALGMPAPQRTVDGACTQDAAVWWLALTRTLAGLTPQLGAYQARSLAPDATASSLLLTSADRVPR